MGHIGSNLCAQSPLDTQPNGYKPAIKGRQRSNDRACTYGVVAVEALKRILPADGERILLYDIVMRTTCRRGLVVGVVFSA